MLAFLLMWVTTVVVAGPSREYAIAAMTFALMFTAFGTAVFIADRKDRTGPPPWAECRFHLPGNKLIEVCVLAAVFGMAFGVVFGGLASLGIAYGNPTVTVAPPWRAIVEVGGVFVLLLTGVHSLLDPGLPSLKRSVWRLL